MKNYGCCVLFVGLLLLGCSRPSVDNTNTNRLPWDEAVLPGERDRGIISEPAESKIYRYLENIRRIDKPDRDWENAERVIMQDRSVDWGKVIEVYTNDKDLTLVVCKRQYDDVGGEMRLVAIAKDHGGLKIKSFWLLAVS